MSESLPIESNLTLNFTPLDSCSATEVLEYSPPDKLVSLCSILTKWIGLYSARLDSIQLMCQQRRPEHKQQWDALQAGGGAEKDRQTHGFVYFSSWSQNKAHGEVVLDTEMVAYSLDQSFSNFFAYDANLCSTLSLRPKQQNLFNHGFHVIIWVVGKLS